MTSAAKRLQRELSSAVKDPLYRVAPLESDILIFHYVLMGAPSTPYEGGYYHGELRFPRDYPLKPPGILMHTPSGRFEINTKLCFSMSDFHPESWQPTWAHGSILMGLISFMNSDELTTGCVKTPTSDEKKRVLARESLAYNCANSKDFVRLFPDLYALWKGGVEKTAGGKEGGASGSPSLLPSSPALLLGADVLAAAGGGPGPSSSRSSSSSSITSLTLPEGLEASLRAVFTTHTNFPKQGVNFVNVLPLWRSPPLRQTLLRAMADGVREKFGEVGFLAGLESRGFLFAPLALSMGLPFVVLRKAGKLPPPVERVSYALEYGEAILEMQVDSGVEGKRGLIVDDLLATGGTLRAARDLLIKCRCSPVGALVVVGLRGLGGWEKAGIPVLQACAWG